MANCGTVTVDVKLTISDKMAETCLELLKLYCDENNKEIQTTYKSGEEGIQMELEFRDISKPAMRRSE